MTTRLPRRLRWRTTAPLGLVLGLVLGLGVAAQAAPATASSLTAPSISSVSPVTGPAGTAVTITGANLNSAASAFPVTSASKITDGVPATPSSAGAGTRLSAAARAAALGGTWRTAREVPGTAALNQGGYGVAESVSCGAAGSCVAGGFYTDAAGHVQAFVASEVTGAWRTAIEVPGTAALNQGGNGQVYEVSCGAAGSCAVGGFYKDAAGHQQAWVASEVNGTWHTAVEVPGTAALNQGGYAALDSVSCPGAGSCAAAGWYTDAAGHEQAFVASEVHGTWHTALEVPGTPALNQDGYAVADPVSCRSAGNCGAGGFYKDAAGHVQAFVASEVHGTWHTALEVPGTAALNQGGLAAIMSVSCATAGNCGAGGYYTDAAGHQQAFAVSEAGGTWHTAVEVPGTPALNQGGLAVIFSVSCAGAGGCAAGGEYTDASGHVQAFVASAVNGTWHTAIEVPGTPALNQGGTAAIVPVSCRAAGSCGAGGFYKDAAGHQQAFVVSELNGTWHTAIEVPGTPALNQGGTATVNSVSCRLGGCAAAGGYTDAAGHAQAFVTSRP